MIGQILFCMAMMGAGPGEGVGPPTDPAADRAAYESARKAAGRDAAAQVRLALWCEAHGLSAERMKHLAAAVLSDPSHALARGLMGLVAYGGKWERPDEVSRQVQEDPRRKALMQEYLQRRARTPDKADDQWRLALWCEQNGLKDQAIVQYHTVLRRDPTREPAWRRLGFKKVGGRWVKPELQAEQKQEAEQQAKANKHWRPLLEKWGLALASRDKARRAEAETALAGVTDPRAVPMIWAVFVPRGPEGQKVAVRLLGQVDSPGSSRALAVLALMSRAAEVRREAAELLKRRDPRDFAPLLIGLIRDPIKYEVRRVNGPGSQGVLLIKNPEVNVRRLYSPPPSPSFALLPTDYVSLDAAGLPVITRELGVYGTSSFRVPSNTPAAPIVGFAFGFTPAPAPNLAAVFSRAGLPAAVAQKMAAAARGPALPVTIAGDRNQPGTAAILSNQTMSIPIGQMMMEAQQAAQVAEAQLESDVQAINSVNTSIRESNGRVRDLLATTVGTDQGDDTSAWARWLTDLFGYAYSSRKTSTETPTVSEEVPLAYQPQAAPVIVNQPVGVQVVFGHSCFGGGTLVQTIDGLRPIESLRAGEDVLTQNPKTGALKYQPLVEVYHNPPNATFRIELEEGDEAIVATGIHRLWKAGQGWTMARELRPGDRLRTLGGIVAVKSVDADRVQPVYNLEVADGESFFVGRSGVLAHDNSRINPTPEPFDAVAARYEPGKPATSGR
jgi:hypothetical protein